MSSESIWRDGAEQFMELEHLSQERALHPALIAQIEQCGGSHLLDFGCGDGRILNRLSSRWIIDAYDPSPQMRRLAAERVDLRLRRLAAEVTELDNEYDVILLGMVILTIPHEAEIQRVLAECANRMHNATALFVTTTHPCFRASRFSNFAASFAADQPFEYLQNGAPFQVTLRDPGGAGVTFTDYHWSLGATVNMLRSQNLYVDSLAEIADDPASSDRNTLVPPFLIIKCRKVV